ncbi:MAG: hypothetical protein WBM41_19130 [Arenicellales bacterium]
MSYLLDQVNTELTERITLQGSPSGSWLKIDFLDSTLKLPGNHHYQFSPLDGEMIEQAYASLVKPVDAVVINLQFAWLNYQTILQFVREKLAPGGRLFFATLGPDTLIELREAWAEIDSSPHVHPFIDLHHIGDQMLKAGFQKPILDVDWIGVEYQDIDLLLQDLRAEGFHNVLPERRKTLTGKNRVMRLKELFSRSSGPVQMTYEVIYGYAEAPSAQTGKIRVNAPTIN